MAKAEIVRREWRTEVRFDEAEVPDVPKSYTSITMRPYAATIDFVAHGDGEPGVDGIILHGHRVNKDGLGVGVTARVPSWNRDRHEWLAPVIEQARGLING